MKRSRKALSSACELCSSLHPRGAFWKASYIGCMTAVLQSSHPNSSRQKFMRVVLIEDNETFRGHFRRLLTMLPNTTVVKELSAQDEAEKWFETHPDDWDLALVDLFLASGNGFKVLKSCSSRSASQKVAVVTNYVTDFVRTQVQAAGADAFFDKTLELDALAEFCKQSSMAYR